MEQRKLIYIRLSYYYDKRSNHSHAAKQDVHPFFDGNEEKDLPCSSHAKEKKKGM